MILLDVCSISDLSAVSFDLRTTCCSYQFGNPTSFEETVLNAFGVTKLASNSYQSLIIVTR
jgi:hypothetical protein